MARRKRKTVSDQLAGAMVDCTAWIVKVSFIGAAHLFKYAVICAGYILRGVCEGLSAVLRSVWSGVKWIAEKNREESIRLDADRREKWETRWSRWTDREEEAAVPVAVLPEPCEAEPDLPQVSFCFIGDAELPPAVQDQEEEDEEDPFEEEDRKEAVRCAKRLQVLRDREDKMRFVHSTTPEEWERYQKTVAWRSLMWDIQDMERRLEYLERTA